MADFVLEAKKKNPNIKIILISHDWAQHYLPKENRDYMPNNISNLIFNFSRPFTDFLEVMHISIDDYPENISSEKIFAYPKDLFSHLSNSQILSEIIAKRILNLD